MIRTLLLLIALLILLAIGAVYMGWISPRQTQQGQLPKFDVEVKDVGIGTTTANVTVPTVTTETKQVEIPTVTVGELNQANAQ
jgi:hypothetical protein